MKNPPGYTYPEILERYFPNADKICPTCWGTGVVSRIHGNVVDLAIVCPRCFGTGAVRKHPRPGKS